MEIDFSFRRYFDEKHTKYEQNVSPGVEFKEVPEEAESLVLIMDDPDAPMLDAFTHWLVWNIPPTDNLPEGLPREKELPSGAVQGDNDFDEIGYGGPKPPKDEWHDYRFRAYALDTELELRPGNKKEQVEQAMEGHIIEKAEEEIPYERDLDESTKAI